MANGLKVRSNVAGMDSTSPMLSSYIKAVEQMKALPSSDPRNWQQQALIHQQHCPHGNWYFLPWHRAYLLAFEEICRDLSGNPDFALPYWNWTVNPSIPEPFWSGTLLDPTRVISSTDRIGAEFVGQSIIDEILNEEDFELFASLKPTGQNNTDEVWQRESGALALLERTPHNNIHNWISGNMASFLSPLDPVFWLHHCNIDRIWAEWNARGRRNTDNILWADFDFRQNFIHKNSTRYDVIVRDLVDVKQLGYSYDVLTQPQETPLLMERVLSRSASIKPQIATLDNLASFSVESSQMTISSAPEKTSPRVLAFLKGVEPPKDLQVSVRVFLNCSYLSSKTPISDPHYVGNFGFFGVHAEQEHNMGHHHHPDEEEHGTSHNMKFDFIFDLTKTIARLTEEAEMKSQLNVQLIPIPIAGRHVQSVEIKVEKVEIVYI